MKDIFNYIFILLSICAAFIGTYETLGGNEEGFFNWLTLALLFAIFAEVRR